LLKKLALTCGIGAIAFLHILPSKASGSTVCSRASYYGHGDIYHGRKTASGERFDGYGLSAAHRSLRFGTVLKVTNPANSRSIIVKVNDRGPFVAGRDLDLSYGAFSRIADPAEGIAPVCYSQVL
jgi:rare lipoprotein A